MSTSRCSRGRFGFSLNRGVKRSVHRVHGSPSRSCRPVGGTSPNFQGLRQGMSRFPHEGRSMSGVRKRTATFVPQRMKLNVTKRSSHVLGVLLLWLCSFKVCHVSRGLVPIPKLIGNGTIREERESILGTRISRVHTAIETSYLYTLQIALSLFPVFRWRGWNG